MRKSLTWQLGIIIIVVIFISLIITSHIKLLVKLS